MKLKITEGINRYDGLPTFHVYKWIASDILNGRWSYLATRGTIQEARDFMQLQIRLGDDPLAEKVVEEFEG
jgi:hypothetical protein